MNEIATQVAQYLTMAVDGVTAAMLFAAFSTTKQKWKALSFAGFVFLIRLLLMLSPLDDYIPFLTILSMFGASFFCFRLSMPMRIFLSCCFWAARAICLFTALGPQNAVNNAAMEIVLRGLENQTLTAPESIQRIFNLGAIGAAVAFAGSYTALMFLILRVVTKSFLYKNYKLRRTEILFLLLPCLSGIAVTQVLRQVLILSDETAAAVLDNATLTTVLIPLTGVVLLLSIAASVKLYQNLIRLRMEETDKKVLEKQMVQIKEQVQDVQDVYGEIRGIRHDMANHLSNIRSLIQAGTDNQEELHRYIGKLEDNLDALRFDCQTGNPITDVMLHQKMLETRSIGIDFESDFLFPEQLDIDSVDIAVILSNALDNALEACRSMQDRNGSRYIKLGAYQKGVMFFIEIENSFVGSLTFDENSGLPVSSKTDGEQHGIGLANIKHCAGKYFGDINISHGGGVFCLTVMLQGR